MSEQVPPQERYAKARSFLEPFRNLSLERSVNSPEEVKPNMLFAERWLGHGLTGLSPKSKALLRQFWERIPLKSSFDYTSEDSRELTILEAEILKQTDEQERQSVYELQIMILMLKTFGINLIENYPALFSNPDESN